jgi:copper(I)-binding protein
MERIRPIRWGCLVRIVHALLGVSLVVAVPAACGAGATTGGPSMSVTEARAYQLPGSEHPIIVVGTVANVTGHEDFLTGGSSPLGGRVELSATAGIAVPEPTGVGTGLNDMVKMEFWRIDPGETIHLVVGGGHLTVIGPDRPVASGRTIEVTFTFRRSPPVTVQVPVD